MKPRILILLIGLVALVGFGLSMRGLLPIPGIQPAADTGIRGGPPPGTRGPGSRRNLPVPVLAETVKTADVPVYLDGVGTVRAYKTATVRAQVSGRLTSVNFKEGQEIRKGDVLAKIDPVTYQAALDQAVAKKAMDQANLDNARRDLDRYTSLARADFASKQQADTQRAAVAQAEAQVRQDQAAIDSAQANLDYSTITAPIDGRTGIRQIDEGNLVNSGDETGIVVITQLRPISVLFTLPETVVSEVATAKGPLSVTANIGSQQLDAGILEVIDNQVDQATGTVKMKGTFENAQGRLWPGQFVNVRLLLKTLDDAIVVSAAAIQQGTVGSYVYVIQPDETAKLTPVRVTQQTETQAVIASGIAPGQQVVTSGFASLQDGARISLSSGTPATTSEPSPSNPRRRRNASAAEPAPMP
jgi:multidrug efflux system membrane fusion protein